MASEIVKVVKAKHVDKVVLVKVYLRSLKNTIGNIRTKLSLDDDVFVYIQAQDPTGDHIEILDDDDMETLEGDIIERGICIRTEGVPSKTKTNETRPRKMITIHGREYAAYEAPPPDSNLVQRELEKMKDDITSIPEMVNELEDVPDCLRLVRFSATVLGDVDTLNTIAVMQHRVGGCVLDDIMNKIRTKTGVILDGLECGFRYLLDGNEDEASGCFHDIRYNFDKLKNVLAGHSKKAATETDTMQDISRFILRRDNEGHDATPSQKAAHFAMKKLMSILSRFADFLTKIDIDIKSFNESIILRILEKVQTSEERNHLLGSPTFQQQSLILCAKLVALQLLCDEYTQGMEEVEEKIKRQLVEDVPRVEEAEKRMKELFEKLRGRLEKRMRPQMESLSESDED